MHMCALKRQFSATYDNTNGVTDIVELLRQNMLLQNAMHSIYILVPSQLQNYFFTKEHMCHPNGDVSKCF